MLELLDRIRAAAPDPVRLTDDELAKLDAYMRAHPKRVRASDIQAARRGDATAKSRTAKAEAEWAALVHARDYNRALRADGVKAPTPEAAGTNPRPKRRSGGRPQVDKAEQRRRDKVVADWEKAKGAGIRQKDFCSDSGIRVGELRGILNWHATRKRRGNGA